VSRNGSETQNTNFSENRFTDSSEFFYEDRRTGRNIEADEHIIFVHILTAVKLGTVTSY
jgi:hypothetical protein